MLLRFELREQTYCVLALMIKKTQGKVSNGIRNWPLRLETSVFHMDVYKYATNKSYGVKTYS